MMIVWLAHFLSCSILSLLLRLCCDMDREFGGLFGEDERLSSFETAANNKKDRPPVDRPNGNATEELLRGANPQSYGG
jgi:hypothetical protein